MINKRKNNKIHLVYTLLAILLIAVIAAGVIIVMIKRSHESELGSLGDLVDDLIKDGTKSEKTIDSLNKSKETLIGEIAQLQAEIAKLQSDFENAGTIYADKIISLQAEIAQKNIEILSLEADIARYEKVYNIDVREQARLIDELIEYIVNNYPYVQMVDTVTVEKDGSETITYKWVNVAELEEEVRLAAEKAGEEYIPGSVLKREDVIFPNISVYYEDLSTGYHLGYNEDFTYNSASVIKAPYILSVLQMISNDEKNYIAALKAEGKYPELIDTNEDGIPDTEIIEYSDPIYDLSETVIYERKTMYKSGSGKIQDMEDGVVFSYLDFIKYALEYSDNVAYQQLRNRYGFTAMYALARKVGANSVVKNGNNMTARDAGKLFKEIYKFTIEDEKYGKIMADSMAKANHAVLINYAVSPTKALHKYGWDVGSYHDAAIVLYSDKPYVIAVFSDLDMGGNDVNAYIREIVKRINVLHKNFYK